MPTRIFGIDPGSVITGYGVIERHGGRLVHIDNGVIRPPAAATHAARLVQIHAALLTLLGHFAPAVVAIEEVFVAKNAQSALRLGQARGVAILATSQAGLLIHEYSSRAVKQAITGYGNATKEQIQKMTARLLHLREPATTDAADALAVAITHAHHVTHP